MKILQVVVKNLPTLLFRCQFVSAGYLVLFLTSQGERKI